MLRTPDLCRILSTRDRRESSTTPPSLISSHPSSMNGHCSESARFCPSSCSRRLSFSANFESGWKSMTRGSPCKIQFRYKLEIHPNVSALHNKFILGCKFLWIWINSWWKYSFTWNGSPSSFSRLDKSVFSRLERIYSNEETSEYTQKHPEIRSCFCSMKWTMKCLFNWIVKQWQKDESLIQMISK